MRSDESKHTLSVVGLLRPGKFCQQLTEGPVSLFWRKKSRKQQESGARKRQEDILLCVCSAGSKTEDVFICYMRTFKNLQLHLLIPDGQKRKRLCRCAISRTVDAITR